MYLEEHNVLRSMRSGFCVFDSRGFNYDRPKEALDELSSWVSEGVHHNQLCFRYGDFSLMTDEMVNAVRTSSNFVQRRVNCVMVVINMAEVYKAFKAADLKPLEATRQLFCSSALRKCSKFSSCAPCPFGFPFVLKLQKNQWNHLRFVVFPLPLQMRTQC